MKKNTVSRRCYRILRWLVDRCYPEITVVGQENLPDEPCIVVGNHSQMHGPIVGELRFPGAPAIWCAAQMMHRKEVPAYAYQDFWSGKPKAIRWFYKLLSHLIAPLSSCIFNNAHTIPVYHDARLAVTFKQTMQALDSGENVLIFPECAKPHNQIVCQFQEHFVDVARRYYKRTGKALCFVPMYLAPKLRTLCLGTPIRFRPEAELDAERSRICTELMAQITELAVGLPVHTVVPYCNVSKKEYPQSR